MIVRQVLRQDAGQSGLVHNDHMVETFASDGADDPLGVGVLPRRPRSGVDLLDAHAVRGGPECGKCMVPIVNEVARGRVFRKGFAELLGRPCRGRMCGDRDMDHAAMMGQDRRPSCLARRTL